MERTVTLLPEGQKLTAQAGDNLLNILRAHELAPDAPCGGIGTCGICTVLVNAVAASV